jgi:magnesium transporter
MKSFSKQATKRSLYLCGNNITASYQHRYVPTNGSSFHVYSDPTKRTIHVAAHESFNVSQVSCTSGDIESIQLPPADILKRTSILPRDLVSLDLSSTAQDHFGRRYKRQRPMTAILPRTDSILLSFGNVRAVAGRDDIFVLDAHTKIAKSFAKDLSRALKSATPDRSTGANDPPELIFLETVLKDTVDTYFRRIQLFEPIVDDFVSRVANEVFSDSGVHQLVPLKDSLQSFELQVKQSLQCLEGLLNNDEEMLDLLVTEQVEARQSGIPVDIKRHQHVEMMLGVYARQMNNILQEIDYLLKRVESKQEFVSLALAGYRNRLVRMNVNIAIVGVSTGITTTIAGLFGMNLIHGFEESPFAFAATTGCSTGLAVMVAAMYFNFISGSAMQKLAAERLAENETLSHALSDMVALDYAVKKMMRGNVTLSKNEFTKLLIEARLSRTVSKKEVNLLFQLLDVDNSKELSLQDFDQKLRS